MASPPLCQTFWVLASVGQERAALLQTALRRSRCWNKIRPRAERTDSVTGSPSLCGCTAHPPWLPPEGSKRNGAQRMRVRIALAAKRPIHSSEETRSELSAGGSWRLLLRCGASLGIALEKETMSSFPLLCCTLGKEKKSLKYVGTKGRLSLVSSSFFPMVKQQGRGARLSSLCQGEALEAAWRVGSSTNPKESALTSGFWQAGAARGVRAPWWTCTGLGAVGMGSPLRGQPVLPVLSAGIFSLISLQKGNSPAALLCMAPACHSSCYSDYYSFMSP